MFVRLVLLAGCLAFCAGCAGQGFHLPFSGPRVTPADSVAVAGLDQRLQKVEADQAEILQLLRGMDASLSARLDAIETGQQETSERLAAQERWIASLSRDGRLSSGAQQTQPQMSTGLPPAAPGAVRLNEPGFRADTLQLRPVARDTVTVHAASPADRGAGTPASGWPTDSVRLPDPPEEGLRRYETAYRELRNGNYQLALINFREFIDRYPRTSLSDNAQYWIGEAYYAQAQYAVAIDEFRKVIDEHPGEDKEPAAYYKIALSFKSLRDPTTARRYFEFLIERFPQTEEAKLAREQLAEL